MPPVSCFTFSPTDPSLIASFHRNLPAIRLHLPTHSLPGQSHQLRNCPPKRVPVDRRHDHCLPKMGVRSQQLPKYGHLIHLLPPPQTLGAVVFSHHKQIRAMHLIHSVRVAGTLQTSPTSTRYSPIDTNASSCVQMNGKRLDAISFSGLLSVPFHSEEAALTIISPFHLFIYVLLFSRLFFCSIFGFSSLLSRGHSMCCPPACHERGTFVCVFEKRCTHTHLSDDSPASKALPGHFVIITRSACVREFPACVSLSFHKSASSGISPSHMMYACSHSLIRLRICYPSPSLTD
jgi:hypothetical protein